MVFTKLSVQEKDAFFNLLDEYFQSRPEVLGQRGGQGVGGTGISTAAAASAVQRAFAANATGGAAGTSGKSNNPYAAALTTPNPNDVAQAVAVGRVAAASLAFSQGAGGHGAGGNLKPTEIPSLPRRAASHVPAPAHAAEQTPGSELDKLVTRKTSVLSAFRKQPTAGVSIPPAFVAPKNDFGPPPVRRVASETAGASTSTGAGAGTGAQRSAAPRAPPRQPEPEPEVAEGEWAEVLYDYTSEDAGDLAIEAGMRVFVTAKSSEDWWTGQVEGQGKEGLFPASYVKLL